MPLSYTRATAVQSLRNHFHQFGIKQRTAEDIKYRLYHQMKPKANISKGKVFSQMTGIHDLEATKELDEHARTKLSIGSPNN